jgi:hypothetical protein
MKNKIKEFFRSLNCFRPGGKKFGEVRKQRVSTFNVISVTLLDSQTAAPAEAARRSMFVNLRNEADSEVALCQPQDYDDDVVSVAPHCEDFLASSSPADEDSLPASPAAAASSATSALDSALFCPCEMMEMTGETIRAVPATADEKSQEV